MAMEPIAQLKSKFQHPKWYLYSPHLFLNCLEDLHNLALPIITLILTQAKIIFKKKSIDYDYD